MLRRTFLTLLGAVAWPWRKKENLPSVTGAPVRIHFAGEIPPGLYHGRPTYIVRNVSSRRIEAGTCVKLVGNNGVIPCNAATS